MTTTFTLFTLRLQMTSGDGRGDEKEINSPKDRTHIPKQRATVRGSGRGGGRRRAEAGRSLPGERLAPPSRPSRVPGGGRGRCCAASRGGVGELAGDTPAASYPFPARSAAGAAGAAVRNSALAPPPAAALCSRARRPLRLRSPRGECGTPSPWVGAKLFQGAEKRWGEGRKTPSAGVRSSRME